MGENKKQGYHITAKRNLYSIQKFGLQPTIGRRSRSVDERYNLLCFTNRFGAIFTWKKRLYENEPYDDYVVLTFDLGDKKYGSRYDSAGDYFTEEAIVPEEVRIVDVKFKKETENIGKNALEALSNVFSSKTREEIIKIMDNEYEISEKPITELFIEKPVFDEEKENDLIEKLAEYEHIKWCEYYDKIDWKGNTQDDGSLKIADSDIEELKYYTKLDYNEIPDWCKMDIRKNIDESFFRIQESDLLFETEITDSSLIQLLEKYEFERLKNLGNSLFNVATECNGQYFIPKEKAEEWKCKSNTDYSDISEENKEVKRGIAKDIINSIQNYKLQSVLSSKEDELKTLEEEKALLDLELADITREQNIFE